jgi:microcystin-dependent protein
MVNIQSAQYADSENTLVYVLYVDNTHKFVVPNDGTLEAKQLALWVAAGNTIAPYQPLISGGVIPIATIMWFCAPRPPAGYLLCDGSEVPRSKYAQLFRAIGTIYGEGDGGTTFNLPNLVGRFVRGWGPVSPLDPTRQFGSQQEDNVAVHTHGYEPIQHTHLITDPGHTHEVVDPGHFHPLADPGHVHSVTDPGHVHVGSNLTHKGFVGAYNIYASGGFETDGVPPYTGLFEYFLYSNKANMVVGTTDANVEIKAAFTGSSVDTAQTGITIDEHGVNIPYTEVGGGTETRPRNIALLPVIRY